MTLPGWFQGNVANRTNEFAPYRIGTLNGVGPGLFESPSNINYNSLQVPLSDVAGLDNNVVSSGKNAQAWTVLCFVLTAIVTVLSAFRSVNRDYEFLPKIIAFFSVLAW